MHMLTHTLLETHYIRIPSSKDAPSLPGGGMTLFLSEFQIHSNIAIGPVCAIYTSLPDTTTLKLFISNADDTQFLPIQDDQAMETRGDIENSGTIRTIRLNVFDIEIFFWRTSSTARWKTNGNSCQSPLLSTLQVKMVSRSLILSRFSCVSIQ